MTTPNKNRDYDPIVTNGKTNTDQSRDDDDGFPDPTFGQEKVRTNSKAQVALERDPRFKKLNTNIGATASEMTYSNDVTLDNQQPKSKKMPPTQTFFAIVKAYCAINVLLLPMSFGEGGYILAPIAMLIALFFQGLSAAQLTSLARKYSIYSYPLIMQRAHGNVGLYVARVCISLAHLQFCIGQVSFTLESLQSTVGSWVGHTSPMWIYGLAIWILYTPIVCIRRLEFLSKAFIFACFMILLGIVTTLVFAIQLINDQGGPGPNVDPINKSSYWQMIGFAFFMFEGIGCLLPVMREAEKPEIYPMQTLGALCLLCTLYVLFAFTCYYAWGSDLTESVVTEMLPPDNTFVQIMKLLFCLNLMISFPITVVPVFHALEAVIGKKETGQQGELAEENEHGGPESQTNAEGETRLQYWLINIMRSGVVFITVLIVLLVYEKLDVFISVAGAVFGMANVLLLPAIAHLKLMAQTKFQRGFDIFLIVFALVMMVFLPCTILMSL